MPSVDHGDLLRHMEWADARTWSAALAVPSLLQDAKMLERLLHYHTTQWAYLEIWRHQPVTILPPSAFADLKALGRRVRGFYDALPSFLRGLNDEILAQSIDFPWVEQLEKRFGKVTPATLAESVLQLVLHTAHHRGQVVTKISEAGGHAPLVDYIAWVWMGRPDPDWGGIGGE